MVLADLLWAEEKIEREFESQWRSCGSDVHAFRRWVMGILRASRERIQNNPIVSSEREAQEKFHRARRESEAAREQLNHAYRKVEASRVSSVKALRLAESATVKQKEMAKMLSLMKTQKDKMEADMQALKTAAQAREAQMDADVKQLEAQVENRARVRAERQVTATRADMDAKARMHALEVVSMKSQLEAAAQAHADEVASIKAELETQAERQVAAIKARLEVEARTLAADEIAAIRTQAETRAQAQAERQAASMKTKMEAETAAVKAQAEAEARSSREAAIAALRAEKDRQMADMKDQLIVQAERHAASMKDRLEAEARSSQADEIAAVKAALEAEIQTQVERNARLENEARAEADMQRREMEGLSKHLRETTEQHRLSGEALAIAHAEIAQLKADLKNATVTAAAAAAAAPLGARDATGKNSYLLGVNGEEDWYALLRKEAPRFGLEVTLTSKKSHSGDVIVHRVVDGREFCMDIKNKPTVTLNDAKKLQDDVRRMKTTNPRLSNRAAFLIQIGCGDGDDKSFEKTQDGIVVHCVAVHDNQKALDVLRKIADAAFDPLASNHADVHPDDYYRGKLEHCYTEGIHETALAFVSKVRQAEEHAHLHHKILIADPKARRKSAVNTAPMFRIVDVHKDAKIISEVDSIGSQIVDFLWKGLSSCSPCSPPGPLSPKRRKLV